MNSPFKEERFGHVQVALPVLEQGLGRQDVGLLLLGGSQSQGAVIGYTAQQPSAVRQRAHNPQAGRAPVLTLSALREASSPAVGQSQPHHVAELLKLGGFVDARRLVPLAHRAEDEKGHTKVRCAGRPSLRHGARLYLKARP